MSEQREPIPARSPSDQLAHELRNPLTIIAARLQMIRRRRSRTSDVPDWIAADLETIEAATARLIAIAEKLDARSQVR